MNNDDRVGIMICDKCGQSIPLTQANHVCQVTKATHKKKNSRLKKYYFKFDKQDNCLEFCNVQNDKAMIGSLMCTECSYYVRGDIANATRPYIVCKRIDEAIHIIKKA